MAKLLTTKGIGFFLDELFKKSKEYIYIVTPYIKIDAQLEERITDALDNGMKITLIYGKDKNQLESLKVASRMEIYFYQNLHAKFYINEKNVLITSMNMHTYSEANNREIGVLLSKRDTSDLSVIDDCLQEFESIKKQSIPINIEYQKKTNYKFSNIEGNSISRNEESIYTSKYFPIVKTIIIDVLGVDEQEIIPVARFVSDLDADSLDLVELVMAVENAFNISIPDEEAEKILTISNAIEYLELHQPSKATKPKGYCIRTGIQIPFNVEKPMSHDAFKIWNIFGDPDYPEKFCHFSGEQSNGANSVSRPILKKNWKKARDIFDF